MVLVRILFLIMKLRLFLNTWNSEWECAARVLYCRGFKYILLWFTVLKYELSRVETNIALIFWVTFVAEWQWLMQVDKPFAFKKMLIFISILLLHRGTVHRLLTTLVYIDVLWCFKRKIYRLDFICQLAENRLDFFITRSVSICFSSPLILVLC